jgi:hypothetical protein
VAVARKLAVLLHRLWSTPFGTNDLPEKKSCMIGMSDRRYCGPQREFLPAHHSDGDVFVNLQLSDGRQTLLLIRAMGQHAAFVDELFGNFRHRAVSTGSIQFSFDVSTNLGANRTFNVSIPAAECGESGRWHLPEP